MKYALIWAVLTIGPQGPIEANIKDTAEFETQQACEDFGKETASRMADWIRGAIRADWEHPVKVDFKCDAGGSPA